jgi:2-polyprenyl-3-methyl-5-hydroxy-6-metoxy-1,4-benzoquinol methylase
MKLWGKTQGAAGDLDFASLDPAYRGFIDDHLGLYGLDRRAFCRPIAAADEMFFKAILPNYEHDAGIAAFKYVESTLRFFDAYEQVTRQVFGGFERLESVLDFASGYGRLTRILTQKLPKERIWVSDIYAEAVAWQARTFGVHAFPSAPSPEALRHEGTHDIVWVGSMFSHLPAPLFHQWLAKLWSFVSPRGVLAFSVHDETLLPDGETMDETGLRYFRFSESGSLDHDIYGMSYVTEAFVGEAIARLAPGGGPKWKRFFKGLYENQDLYVVAGPEADISGLRVASTPMGGIEQAAQLTNGDVEFSGWTLERTPGARIEQLRVHVGDVAVGCAPADQPRPDVLRHFPHAANQPMGFRFRLSPAQAKPGATIRLQLESTSGLRGHLFARMPAAAALTYSGWSRRALRTEPTGLG